MAISRSCGLLWFSAGILLLLCSAKAKKDKGPLANVNLSPFQQWRSAYECMQNHSDTCSWKYELDITGVVSVSQDKISNYCQKGCADHIYIVLTCINYVKRDFKFGNGYTVPLLNGTITHACVTNTALNTTAKITSSATRIYKGLPVTLMSALPTVLLMIIFNI